MVIVISIVLFVKKRCLRYVTERRTYEPTQKSDQRERNQQTKRTQPPTPSAFAAHPEPNFQRVAHDGDLAPVIRPAIGTFSPFMAARTIHRRRYGFGVPVVFPLSYRHRFSGDPDIRPHR